MHLKTCRQETEKKLLLASPRIRNSGKWSLSGGQLLKVIPFNNEAVGIIRAPRFERQFVTYSSGF